MKGGVVVFILPNIALNLQVVTATDPDFLKGNAWARGPPPQSTTDQSLTIFLFCMFWQTEINTLGFKVIHFHNMTTNVLVTDNKQSVPVALFLSIIIST